MTRSLARLTALSCILAMAACGSEERSSSSAAAAEASSPAAPAPAAAATEAPGGGLNDLAAATREYVDQGCAAARRRLERCAACDGAEQKPLRDLLLAHCAERESKARARELYEAIITAHPNTYASVAAIMHVRQIDAAELPPPGAAASGAVPVSRPQPAYPPLAEAANVDGRVRLRFDVRDDGSVGNVRVIESTPPLLFDAVALYAVTSWTYEPGHPAADQQIALRFDLDGSGQAASAEAAK